MDPDFPGGFSYVIERTGGFSYVIERNGRHVGTRTPDLYRVKVTFSGNSLTFNGTGSHLWRCKERSATVNGP